MTHGDTVRLHVTGDDDGDGDDDFIIIINRCDAEIRNILNGTRSSMLSSHSSSVVVLDGNRYNF